MPYALSYKFYTILSHYRKAMPYQGENTNKWDNLSQSCMRTNLGPHGNTGCLSAYLISFETYISQEPHMNNLLEIGQQRLQNRQKEANICLSL